MNIDIVEKIQMWAWHQEKYDYVIKNIALSSSYFTASQTRQNDVKLFK